MSVKLSKEKKKKHQQSEDIPETEAENTETETEETLEQESQPEEKAEEVSEKSAADKAAEEEKNRFLRLMADFENYKRRTQAEKEGLYSMAIGDAVLEFIPALDNLERALQYAEDSSLKKGVEMVYNQMLSSLKKLGVSSFGEKGDQFDPNLHEAIMHSEEEGVEPNTITEVMQKGYKTENKVIRHALVKVAN